MVMEEDVNQVLTEWKAEIYLSEFDETKAIQDLQVFSSVQELNFKKIGPEEVCTDIYTFEASYSQKTGF